jgi:CRP/FNR family cyclic AMP-dependent transcriptional regulator
MTLSAPGHGVALTLRNHLGCGVLGESVRGTVCAALFTGKPLVVPRGKRIFDAGDSADVLFQVRSGLVKLTAVTSSGDEMLLDVYYPDSVFGELCFCDDHQHTATATAVEDAEILMATREQLRDLIREQPELALALFGEFASRLSSAYANLQTAVFDAVVTRVAARLLDLAAHANMAVETPGELPHKVSHADLAEMLGVRRETVTRAMVDLRRLNLISYAPDGRLRLAAESLREFINQSARPR